MNSASDLQPNDTPEHARCTLETAAGRRNLFNRRIDQLMLPSRDPQQRTLTLDEALYALRTSEDSADKELLAAMGEAPTAVRKERLQMDRFRTQMQQTMEQNAKAGETSPEVAKALAGNDRGVVFTSSDVPRDSESKRALAVSIEPARFRPTAAS